MAEGRLLRLKDAAKEILTEGVRSYSVTEQIGENVCHSYATIFYDG